MNIIILQVDQVLTIEELLPNQLRRRCRRTYKEVHPNRKEKTRKLVKTKIDFTIWGGDNYETRDGIERALPSSVNYLYACIKVYLYLHCTLYQAPELECEHMHL